MKNKSKFEACIKSERNITFKIFEKPDENSKTLGTIKVTEIQGTLPVDIKWVKPEGNAVTFNIDGILAPLSEYLRENSHTYIGCQGNWYKLPRNPFPTPVWIKKDEPCNETKGVNEGKLKWDLVATEVGTNRRVLLPRGKILETHYENGKVMLSVSFRHSDIGDDHPDILEALKSKQKHEEMSRHEIMEFISDKKDEILNEYSNNGTYKARYVLEMKDFLDKDSHLPLTLINNSDWENDVEAKYLDEEKKGKDTQPKN